MFFMKLISKRAVLRLGAGSRAAALDAKPTSRATAATPASTPRDKLPNRYINPPVRRHRALFPTANAVLATAAGVHGNLAADETRSTRPTGSGPGRSCRGLYGTFTVRPF